MKIVPRVTEVASLDDRRLRVSFNDGVVRDVDCVLSSFAAPSVSRCVILSTSSRCASTTRAGRWSGPTDSIRRLSYCTGISSRGRLRHHRHAPRVS